MAAELREAFGVEATLHPGANGIFDVIVDGKCVYSKFDLGRFPEPLEVVALIAP